MVKLIEGLPANVVGVHIGERVTGEDYERVIIPAIEAALAKFPKTRILYVIDEGLESFEVAAMWQDAKVGLKHLFQFERIAVVTDAAGARGAIKAMGFLIPCPVHVYAAGELADAKGWIAE